MHAYCFPIQVATGETSAMQKLALGTRIILEHGTTAVVSGDAANAYNSLERASLLRSSMASSPASHSHPPPRRRQPRRNAG